jgi:hypothetical protein
MSERIARFPNLNTAHLAVRIAANTIEQALVLTQDNGVFSGVL